MFDKRLMLQIQIIFIFSVFHTVTENPPENVGVGGELISDRGKK